MKKQFIVYVDIDTEAQHTSRIWADHGDPSKWHIEVGDDSKKVGDSSQVIASVLAHELGHFVAFACQLQHTTKNPNFLGTLSAGLSYDQAILNTENEAWDVAEMMFTMKRTRALAIKTYEPSTQLYESKHRRLNESLSKR
jgi:hypothetical protein